MAPKRSVPPARSRYEQRNPTISIRVSTDIRDRLQQLRERSGKSLGDILREALDVQEPATAKAYRQGFVKGRAEGEKIFRVDYRCGVCNGRIPIVHDATKRAVATYMRENGWVHASCNRQRG